MKIKIVDSPCGYGKTSWAMPNVTYYRKRG